MTLLAQARQTAPPVSIVSTARTSLLAQVDKLRRANSKLRRKYRDLRIATDEQAERMEALQLELEALKAAGAAMAAPPKASPRARAAKAATDGVPVASKPGRRPRSD